MELSVEDDELLEDTAQGDSHGADSEVPPRQHSLLVGVTSRRRRISGRRDASRERR